MHPSVLLCVNLDEPLKLYYYSWNHWWNNHNNNGTSTNEKEKNREEGSTVGGWMEKWMVRTIRRRGSRTFNPFASLSANDARALDFISLSRTTRTPVHKFNRLRNKLPPADSFTRPVITFWYGRNAMHFFPIMRRSETKRERTRRMPPVCAYPKKRIYIKERMCVYLRLHTIYIYTYIVYTFL